MSANSQIIFGQLFERYAGTRIPLIQRDYAQGRADTEEVRSEFLGALARALALPPDDPSLPLNLDFVYGTLNPQRQFVPLDGQQRLTTLFLLHWYLAQRDGELAAFAQLFCNANGSARFAYSVRPSSSEFFDALSQHAPSPALGADDSLIEHLTDQPWYFRHWRLDPTIQSCLTMLQAMHERFHNAATARFARLIDVQRPVISFQILDLDDFGLADDLYIKMNARGMPLTAFETFKARYERHLHTQFDGHTRQMHGKPVSTATFFAWRMDTRWADFFWNFSNARNDATAPATMRLFDQAVMNLLQMVAAATRAPEAPGYEADLLKLRNRQQRLSYQVYEDNGWLDDAFSETLMLLLEAWSEGPGSFATQLPTAHYFDEVAFFNHAISDQPLNYTRLVQFCGYAMFLRRHGSSQPQAFGEWMRLVVNLSVNASYDGPDDIKRSVSGLGEMLEQALDILAHFASVDRPVSGFRGTQVREEITKAKLIVADSQWRPLLEHAEQHGYFQGQIDFLLDHSSAAWALQSHAHATWQEHFASSLALAEQMFDDHGLRAIDDFLWERALLSEGDYLLKRGYNHSFLGDGLTGPGTWKRLLANEDGMRVTLFCLWNRLDETRPLPAQLQRIIDQARVREPWRQVLIQTPSALGYCALRQLRFERDQVYLLARERMSGSHAELFSFALHQQLQTPQRLAQLAPLSVEGYVPVSGSADEPYFYLLHRHSPQVHTHLYVTSTPHGFLLQIDVDELLGRDALAHALQQDFDFVVKAGYLQSHCSRDTVEQRLVALAGVLAA